MNKILLCEPNVSEGRDLELVQQILVQVLRVPGVKLLHSSSDPDHNRSVFTYLGEPGAVLEATKAMTAKALELIDMRKHYGSHPRMGAVDVVPFIPVREITIEEAVEVAREFGKFLGALGVPVYYYQDAATRPERRDLPTIRKGQYEALEAKLLDPAWAPDEGPAKFNPKSGATVTGVRFPLIAFNVNLATNDLALAERIAKAIRTRFTKDGHRRVRTIALPLREQNIVQVSTNILNYTKTPIAQVLEAIRAEAARDGISVVGTQIIGPVPLEAISDGAKHYLQALDFSADQIIETALIEGFTTDAHG